MKWPPKSGVLSSADAHVHLVLENDRNDADCLSRDFDAQWNDDAHHFLHVLLTGEHDGYYADYVDRPADKLARCLREGFGFQGELSQHRGGKPRGMPSAHLPPTAFVSVPAKSRSDRQPRLWGAADHARDPGRPAQRRRHCCCSARRSRCSSWVRSTASRRRSYFSPITIRNLPRPCAKDARRNSPAFSHFSDPALIARLPDPNSRNSFEHSRPVPEGGRAAARPLFYHELLKVRRAEIVPRLPNTHALDAHALGAAAVVARWQMGDGSLLTVACNLGQPSVGMPSLSGRVLFATSQTAEKQASTGQLSGCSTVAALDLK